MSHPEYQLNCPKCGGHMNKRSERGVTVDECVNCQGIFLDAGELGTIIANITSQQGFRPRPAAYAQPTYGHGHRQGRSHHRSSSDGLFGGFFGS